MRKECDCDDRSSYQKVYEECIWLTDSEQSKIVFYLQNHLLGQNFCILQKVILNRDFGDLKSGSEFIVQSRGYDTCKCEDSSGKLHSIYYKYLDPY